MMQIPIPQQPKLILQHDILPRRGIIFLVLAALNRDFFTFIDVHYFHYFNIFFKQK